MSCVKFVDHDWTRTVGVSRLTVRQTFIPFNKLHTIEKGIHVLILYEDEEISVKGAL